MEAFVSMRETEGENLKKDIVSRLNTISEIRDKIEEYAPKALAVAKEKVRERITKLLEGVAIDESRLLTECAILADKTDISFGSFMFIAIGTLSIGTVISSLSFLGSTVTQKPRA